MIMFQSIDDLMQRAPKKDSFDIERESTLIQKLEEAALEIETNETKAYISASSIILNC